MPPSDKMGFILHDKIQFEEMPYRHYATLKKSRHMKSLSQAKLLDF